MRDSQLLMVVSSGYQLAGPATPSAGQSVKVSVSPSLPRGNAPHSGPPVQSFTAFFCNLTKLNLGVQLQFKNSGDF